MFEDRSAEGIKRALMEAAAATGVGLSTEAGGFLDHLLGPVALELWTLYSSLDAVLPVAFVDESSGAYIDARCAEYGIERKAGTKATAIMALTGRVGTVVPAGTAFLTPEGLEFDLLEAVILAGGAGQGTVEAAAVGSAYNVEAGAITQMVVTLPGLDAWTNEAAVGGSDAETDEALYGRLSAHLQKPRTSGNVYDYEQWALEIEGVGAVRVTSLWDGPGTVKIVVAGPNREPVAEAVVDACAAHIEGLRPIGATVTVRSAIGLTVNVAATVTIEPSTTPAAVAVAFRARLEEHLKSIAFTGQDLLYNRVAYLLLGIDGVSDYSVLTVNGGIVNVEIGPEQVPVLGEVNVE